MVSRFRIKRYYEFIPTEKLELVPNNKKGIYVLLKKRKKTRKHRKERYDVVYVGMSKSDIKGRLITHKKSKKKSDLWNCFSIFEVDNKTTKRAIQDMEEILIQIYRKDSKANRLNVAKKYKKISHKKVLISKWK
jgi:hypothetical protein